MRFEFDESRYTTKRGSIGEFSAEERDEIAVLRRNHPELHAWGDLAIEQAWRAYSDAVLMMGWSSDLSRSEDFLSFVCWEQTRGEWPWGNATDGLAEVASVWKNAA
jgi:hypothetical protein